MDDVRLFVPHKSDKKKTTKKPQRSTNQPQMITEADIAKYNRDGVVCLRDVISPEWLRHLTKAATEVVDDPGLMHEVIQTPTSPLTYFTDLEMSNRLSSFDLFTRQGPCAEIAGMLMRSQEVCFLYDQYFEQTKNNTKKKKKRRGGDVQSTAINNVQSTPTATTTTPWHQDQPYWQVEGKDVVSVWIPLDPTPENFEVQFIRGSHLWPEHSPFHFGSGEQYVGTGMPNLPDINQGIDDGSYEVLSFPDAQPGDVIVFSAMTVHGQRPKVNTCNGSEELLIRNLNNKGKGKGKNRKNRTRPAQQTQGSSPFEQFRRLATRFTGDDARFKLRSGEASEVIPSRHYPAELEEGDEMECERHPLIWTRRNGNVDNYDSGEPGSRL